MPTETTDIRSSRREQIANAAEVVGRSPDRRKVFAAICRGKKKVKTISEIEKITGLRHIRVLQEAGKLASHSIIKKSKIEGEMAYAKDDFIAANKVKILRLAGSSQALAEFSTKSNPRIPSVITIPFPAPRKMIDR